MLMVVLIMSVIVMKINGDCDDNSGYDNVINRDSNGRDDNVIDCDDNDEVLII